jgi:hypothetical protein
MSAVYRGCFGCANPKMTTAEIDPDGDIALCEAHWELWLSMFDPRSDSRPPCAAHLITEPATR